MAVLLVTYDLNKEGKSKVDYNKFYEIRDKYDHVKLSESSYAFNTNETPEAIYAKMKTFLDKDDYIYIANLKKPHAGSHSDVIVAWLNKNVPY